MPGVLFRLGSRTTSLEANTGGTGPAVTGSHGDKLHQIQRNVFIAPRSYGDGGHFFHRVSPLWRSLNFDDSKSWSSVVSHQGNSIAGEGHSNKARLAYRMKRFWRNGPHSAS